MTDEEQIKEFRCDDGEKQSCSGSIWWRKRKLETTGGFYPEKRKWCLETDKLQSINILKKKGD